MSRSYKKRPIAGACKGSERLDKKIWHRKLRRKFSSLLVMPPFHLEEIPYPVEQEVSDPWEFTKDGKSYQYPIPHEQRKEFGSWGFYLWGQDRRRRFTKRRKRRRRRML